MTSKQPSASTSLVPVSDRRKRKRSQRPSCDACRLRKIRCDNKEKVDEWANTLGKTYNQLSPSIEASIACSLCISRGLRCTFVHYSETKTRNGRRILEIQQDQLQECIQDQPAEGFETNVEAPINSKGLLGVQDLTKSLLECCFKMFFRVIAPVRPILHVERFREAHNNYFAPLDLRTGQVADELLLLAVVCLGAKLLEPPIARADSSAKFELSNRCLQRYIKVFQERDWIDWWKLSNASDVIEAMYLMSDCCFDPLVQWKQIRTSTLEAQERKLNSKSKTSDGQRKSIDIVKNTGTDPFSHRLLIDMAFALCINKAPKINPDCAEGDPRRFLDGNGISITSEEKFRRKRIFWAVYGHDTLRCFTLRQTPLIGDDDFDQQLPTLYDSKATIKEGNCNIGPLRDYSIYQSYSDSTFSDINPSPANILAQRSQFALFDGLYLEHSLRLVFFIRSIGVFFTTVRVQGKGIKLQDVLSGIDAIKSWKKSIPIENQFETTFQSLMNKKVTLSFNLVNMETARSNATKSLWLIYLYHKVVHSMWEAIRDFGIHMGSDDSTELASLIVFRLGLKSSKGKQQMFTADDLKEAIQKMDELVVDSFYQISGIAKQAQSIGLFESCHIILAGVMVAFFSFGVDLVRSKKDVDVSIINCCQDLLNAISTIRSCSEKNELCRQMNSCLSRQEESFYKPFNESTTSIDDDISNLSKNALLDPNSWLSDWFAQEMLDSLAPMEFDANF